MVFFGTPCIFGVWKIFAYRVTGLSGRYNDFWSRNADARCTILLDSEDIFFITFYSFVTVVFQRDSEEIFFVIFYSYRMNEWQKIFSTNYNVGCHKVNLVNPKKILYGSRHSHGTGLYLWNFRMLEYGKYGATAFSRYRIIFVKLPNARIRKVRGNGFRDFQKNIGQTSA